MSGPRLANHDDPNALSRSALAAGTQLGDFEIVRPLGSGGMGEVYVAREHATDALIALKVHRGASALDAARFDREGRISMRLRHPHIVASLGHGRTPEGLGWLALELLAGHDLDAQLGAAVLSIPEVVSVAVQVCDALEYAHARGVIHRDLKPSNIFLCEGPVPRVKILDFGIARALDDPLLTRTGSVLGTPTCMSPEQARGERDLDARTDLWSLGVVLHRCLTGSYPFRAESLVGTLYRIMYVAPVHVSALRHDVPPALAAVVHRALCKARDERFATAAAMRAALLAVDLAAVPTSRAPVSNAPEATDETLHEAEAAEVRLTSAVFLREPRDAVLVEDIARDLRGRVERLAGDGVLVLFGVDRWTGDEPRRAVRLAHTVSASAEAVGVATGRVLRSARSVAGGAIDAAVALVGPERDTRRGVWLDATTAATVEADFPLAYDADGTAACLDPRASHLSAPVPVTAWRAPFVGRDAESEALLRCVKEAGRKLRPQALAFQGVAGIGKTRLCDEAVATLRARVPDATCVLLRGDLARSETPYGALRDALARDIDPSAAATLPAATSRGGDPQALLDRARNSLAALVQGWAERGPVVLAVDDVQWLDAASRAMLRWLRERSRDQPLALWVFGRSGSAQVAEEVAGVAPCELVPLEPEAAAKLLHAVAGEAPEALLERAGGHPLFLEELGRRFGPGASSEGLVLPLSVEGACLAHLDAMEPAEREFLKCAAVYGRTFWVEAVSALGGDDAVVEPLRDADVIRARRKSRLAPAREFQFRVSLLAEAVYALLPDEARARLHAQAAAWLTGREGAAPDEVARHRDLAGQREQAAQSYADAAALAASLGDAETALAHAARVLERTETPSLRWRALAARDDALQFRPDLDLRRRGVEAMDALAPGLTLGHQTETAWRRCYLARVTGDTERALTSGRRARELAGELGDPRWIASVDVEMAYLHAAGGRHEAAREAALEACARADAAGDAWLGARALSAQAYVRAEAGELAASQGLFVRAAEEFKRLGDRRREALNRGNAASMMLTIGRVDEAAREMEAAIEAAGRVGNLPTVATSTHNLGVARRMLGDLAAAAAMQDRAEALAAELKHARLACHVAIERVYLALESGRDPDACVALAEAALGRAREVRSPVIVASALASALRAGARAGGDVTAWMAEARTMADALTAPEPRAELRVAIWEASGRAEGERVAARAAIEAVAAGLDEADDRSASHAAFTARYQVPEECFGE